MQALLDDSRWKGRSFNGQWQPAGQTAPVTDKSTG